MRRNVGTVTRFTSEKQGENWGTMFKHIIKKELEMVDEGMY